MSTASRSRRGFLQVVGQGALGCALAGCSSPNGGPPADAAAPRDLASGHVTRDLTSGPDLRRPADLTSGPDQATPPDLACGGIVVPPSAMPDLNEARYFDAHKVFIARDVAGYMALSPICSHMTCAVVYMPRQNGQAFICPCHGSTFQLDGTYLSGVAPLPLDHVSLCWQDDSKQVLLLNPQVLIFDPAQRV